MDRQTKRMIGTIIGILVKIAKIENNWDVQLLYTLYTYYSTIHEVTKETPFFIVYGRNLNRPLDGTLHTQSTKRVKVKEYMHEVVKRMEEGDLVWLDNQDPKMRQYYKMAKKWMEIY